jgi:hypothetical protein
VDLIDDETREPATTVERVQPAARGVRVLELLRGEVQETETVLRGVRESAAPHLRGVVADTSSGGRGGSGGGEIGLAERARDDACVPQSLNLVLD